MTALDSRYIVGIELGEYFVDPRTTLPLSGGKIFFYKDLARSIPKLVYQLTGSPPNYEYAPLPNELTLSDAGTIVNSNEVECSIYYFPWDADGNIERYYIRVEAADGEVIKEFQAWPNNFEAGDTPTGEAGTSENQVSNSQFVDVDFNPDYGVTINFSGAVTNEEYQIAPDWFLRVSSNASGSIIVGRTALAGSLNIATNPPFMLTISPQGNSVSAISLIQRLNHNPDIWARQYIAATMTVTSLDGINHSFEMQYAPSVAVSPTTIFTGSSGASGYTTLSGTVLLGLGVNTEDGDIGYVDLITVLPVSGNYALTSVQAFGTTSSATLIPYQQETVNRQEDHLFHYYNPLIQQVPVPSISEGWDFKVNPAQFGASVVMGAVASQYLWDQLIGWQSVNSSLAVDRAAPRSLVAGVTNTTQFALIQYLSGPQLRQLLANDFSVLMKAYSNNVSGHSGTVSFWVTTDATLPNVATGTNLSLIATVDANGKPATFHGNWTEIPRNYRGDARFTIPYGTEMSEIALEGWNRTARDLDATYTYGAIVVGFTSTAPSNVFFDSIAVTPGLLARPYAPLSYDLTLAQMQYYYEKSYAADVVAGANTVVNALNRPQMVLVRNLAPNNAEVLLSAFCIEYNSIKRAAPTARLYTPSGAIDIVSLIRGNVGVSGISAANWTQAAGTCGAQLYPNNSSGFDSGTNLNPAAIEFHYVADARYGIVL